MTAIPKEPRLWAMWELQERYLEQVTKSETRCLNLGAWLPSLGYKVRPLVPGELCFIMADTGHGKSMALQCIAATQSEPVLFFELELPGTLLFERFVAHSLKLRCDVVEQKTRDGELIDHNALGNISVCEDTRLSLDQMKHMIETVHVERIGSKPFVVFVDYIGLMASSGKSRYERTSSAAEDLKVLAKETNTIVIAATQRSRPEEGEHEVSLHDGKDSGSLENSCGLLLGMWRDPSDRTIMHVRILKNTKGQSGDTIRCNVDGARMSITECAREPGYREGSER